MFGRDYAIGAGTRYELKYVVDPFVAASLRDFVRGLLPPDPFAAPLPEFRYTIGSLYFDTPDLRLYQQTREGKKNRFKLRIRSYSDDPTSPLFLEVKRRVNTAVIKHRARLDRSLARTIAGAPLHRWAQILGPDDENRQIFPSLASLSSAEPFVRVRYRREAYAGDRLRITFDTELCHAVTRELDFSVARGTFAPTPVGGVIFEVKFTERYPSWVADMVRLFGLSHRSVPKYVLSMERALGTARRELGSFLSVGGSRTPEPAQGQSIVGARGAPDDAVP